MKNKQNDVIALIQKDFFVKHSKLYKNIHEKNLCTHYDHYSVTYIKKGKFKVTKLKKDNEKELKTSLILSEGDIIISSIGEREIFEQLIDGSECITFEILPVVFKNTDDEFDIFRIFNYSNIKSIFNVRDFSSNFIENCFNSLIFCLQTNKGRFHSLLRVKSIISQLDFELDILLGEIRRVNENMLIKTTVYIEENYAKNLTLDSVSDFLGISKSSINRICNRMKGKSFSAYLTEVRMKNARQMLYNPTNNIKTIALLCGYNSYDSFYHAFVKYYGYPPSKNTIKRTKNWPFESSKFDLYKEYE